MSIFKRDLAPISKEIWSEIDERAKDVFNSYLSARKVVNFIGPFGIDYNVLSEGRIAVEESKEGVNFGIYKVKPLVEQRIDFELNRWELDNIFRGAKDIDFSPLEDAAKRAALFEENAIYNSLSQANIKGIIQTSSNKIEFGNSSSEIMESLAKGILELRSSYVKSDLVLIVGPDNWKKINKFSDNYPLKKKIEESLGTKIILSHVLDGAILMPLKHEDIELIVGQDFSIGYHNCTEDKIKFFIMESFTFRILDPDIIVKFE